VRNNDARRIYPRVAENPWARKCKNFQWADFLNDWKCGGPREVEEGRDTAELQTVDAENIAWFRWALNDRENDMWELERIPPSSQS